MEKNPKTRIKTQKEKPETKQNTNFDYTLHGILPRMALAFSDGLPPLEPLFALRSFRNLLLPIKSFILIFSFYTFLSKQM